MKTAARFVLISSLLVAASAHADPEWRGFKHRRGWVERETIVFEDTARVVSVVPRYVQVVQVVEPAYRRCYTERVVVNGDARSSSSSNSSGAVIGGIAGAIVGNQVGQGNGRIAATAIGAATGAIVGDRIQNTSTPVPTTREVTHCGPARIQESRLDGYDVAYEYRGVVYRTVMTSHPGEVVHMRGRIREIY